MREEWMCEVDPGDVEGGGVTSFAESLHPRNPSCVLLLLCNCSTSMGGG